MKSSESYPKSSGTESIILIGVILLTILSIISIVPSLQNSLTASTFLVMQYVGLGSLILGLIAKLTGQDAIAQPLNNLVIAGLVGAVVWSALNSILITSAVQHWVWIFAILGAVTTYILLHVNDQINDEVETEPIIHVSQGFVTRSLVSVPVIGLLYYALYFVFNTQHVLLLIFAFAWYFIIPGMLAGLLYTVHQKTTTQGIQLIAIGIGMSFIVTAILGIMASELTILLTTATLHSIALIVNVGLSFTILFSGRKTVME